jgi:hypothetical protein
VGEVTLKLNTTSTLDLLNITLKVIQIGNHHSGDTVHVSRILLKVKTQLSYANGLEKSRKVHLPRLFIPWLKF